MPNDEHREHTERKRRAKRSFFDSYWFEITVVALIGLGIFLLLERLEIKATVWGAAVSLAHTVASAVRSLARGISGRLHTVETSDLVGIGLIVAALGLLAWKLRLRAIRRHPSLSECPRCSGNLERVRCRLFHRLLAIALWVHIRHYSCNECTFRAAVWSRRRE